MKPLFSKRIESLLWEMEKYSRAHKKVWSIPADEARFLYLITALKKPKSILEVGTSIGYSTIWLGLGAREFGGRITTLENDPKKIRMARENFRRAGLARAITVIPGDASSTLRTLGGKYDLVFLDAIKQEYRKYLDLIYPRLARDAVVLADNAGDLGHLMRDYLHFVREGGKFHSTFVPVGNGIELSLKI